MFSRFRACSKHLLGSPSRELTHFVANRLFDMGYKHIGGQRFIDALAYLSASRHPEIGTNPTAHYSMTNRHGQQIAYVTIDKTSDGLFSPQGTMRFYVRPKGQMQFSVQKEMTVGAFASAHHPHPVRALVNLLYRSICTKTYFILHR